MRGIGFLHRQLHKIFPPPIESPYLYGPYAKVLRRTLSEYASKAKIAVEFGIFHGYTTSLIAHALPANGRLYSYDINSIPELAGKISRTDIKVHFEQKGIYSWLNDPFHFDFMWIDVAATPDQMWIIHQRLKPFLADSVVLSEGTHRVGDKRITNVPHEDLCTIPPGLFRLLP